jgi:hypothetical protein
MTSRPARSSVATTSRPVFPDAPNTNTASLGVGAAASAAVIAAGVAASVLSVVLLLLNLNAANAPAARMDTPPASSNAELSSGEPVAATIAVRLLAACGRTVSRCGVTCLGFLCRVADTATATSSAVVRLVVKTGVAGRTWARS